MADPLQAFRAAVLSTLGSAPETIEPGRFHRFATSERRGDSAGWCKIFDDMRGGVFGCYRQGITETWVAADRAVQSIEQRMALARQMAAATAERLNAQRQMWGENAQRITRVWKQTLPLSPDDPVARYLSKRGVRAGCRLPDALRFHPALPYWHGSERVGIYPAMVAPLTTPEGRVVALHRTYLSQEGNKADVPSPKKLSGTAGPLAGACIALHQPVRGVIGIAEGIETALAAWQASGVPTVASYCAGNLAAWQWPASAQRLVIFGDADRAGRDAAQALKARAVAAWRQCEVLTPAAEGADWCDVWVAAEHGPIDGEAAA